MNCPMKVLACVIVWIGARLMAVDLDPVKDGGATARSKQTGGAAAGESDRKAAANPFDQFDAPEQVAAAAESDRKAAAGAAGARELTALAMKGNAEAAFLLGVMYAEGDGVAKDSAKAVSYFRQANEKIIVAHSSVLECSCSTELA